MADFVDVQSIDQKILATIEELLSIRTAAQDYVKLPNDENSDALAFSVDKFSNHAETLKLNLIVMIKQANGNSDEVLGTETGNGIEL